MVITLIDIVLIVLYFLAIAVVGYLSSRKKTVGGYLIAEKKLSTWQSIATLTASKISAGLIVTYVSLVYVFGISAIWAFVGIAIGYILFLLFAIRLKKEGDVHKYHSIADYFYHRYGLYTGRLVGIVIFLTLFLNFVIQLIAGAKILNAITGLAFSFSVILTASIILFYLYFGGFRAVVKTDVVQFIAIITLFIILGIFLFSNFTFEAAHWDLLSAGPALIIPLLLIGMLFPFSAPDLWQRALAAKNVRILKKSFIWATIIYVSFGMFLSLIALAIRTKLPGIDADVALVEGFIQLLPAGLLGAGLVALFAAIMSTADSYAFICAGLLMHDVLLRNRGRSIQTLKWGILITMLLGIVTALIFQEILATAFLLTGILMVFSVIVIATWIKKGIKSTTLNYGILIGLFTTIVVAAIVGMIPLLIVVGLIGGLIGLGIGSILTKYIHLKN